MVWGRAAGWVRGPSREPASGQTYAKNLPRDCRPFTTPTGAHPYGAGPAGCVTLPRVDVRLNGGCPARGSTIAAHCGAGAPDGVRACSGRSAWCALRPAPTPAQAQPVKRTVAEVVSAVRSVLDGRGGVPDGAGAGGVTNPASAATHGDRASGQ